MRNKTNRDSAEQEICIVVDFMCAAVLKIEKCAEMFFNRLNLYKNYMRHTENQHNRTVDIQMTVKLNADKFIDQSVPFTKTKSGHRIGEPVETGENNIGQIKCFPLFPFFSPATSSSSSSCKSKVYLLPRARFA